MSETTETWVERIFDDFVQVRVAGEVEHKIYQAVLDESGWTVRNMEPGDPNQALVEKTLEEKHE